MSESRITKLTQISREQAWITGGTLLTTGIADLALHGGTPGLVAGVAASIFMARHSKDILDSLVPGREVEGTVATTTRIVDAALPVSEYADQSAGAKMRRMFGVKAQESDYATITPVADNAVQDTSEEDELQPMRPSSYTFSHVLKDFQPSLQRIFLASQVDGTPLYSDAKGLCHVALAGATGGGKSCIMRLLMAQLCKAGATVLLLNPHYTGYDLDADEDWTPFEPSLLHPPMECRQYEVIEHYLKQCANVLLPKRLERYAHSQPTGKPYFIVIDELPAIVANIPNAPEYLAKILREGRKVGIFLITAAQDFLVKTISPQGGGAMRECYRTAYYVGGDGTTAKMLLDMPANQIEENELGKGTVMLRNLSVKKAVLAYVPYVDNQALYKLLGPSTYKPTKKISVDYENDNFLENLQPQSQEEAEYLPRHNTLPHPSDSYKHDIPQPLPVERPSGSMPAQPAVSKQSGMIALPQHLKETLEILRHEPNIPYSDLGKRLGVAKATAFRYVELLRKYHFVGERK